jgi:kynureninase
MTVLAVPHADLLARRADYPILETSTAYLVNNSLGAVHRDTRARLGDFAGEWETQGAAAWPDWFAEMSRVADLVGEVIGALPGTTVLRQSVADALVAVASAVDLTGSRKQVVTTAADWPGSHYFWTEHCRRYGGEVVVVPFQADGVTIDAQRVADAVDDRTAVVSVSLVQFRTSALLDLEPVRDAARSHGALLVVDAYQAAGILPVEMVDRDIDICLGGSVKYLCGGPGNGWLSVRPDLAETLRPAAVGWISHERPFDFSFDAIDYAPGIGRFMGGTPNVPAAYAAKPGFQAIIDVGVQRIRERSMGLTQLIVEDALQRGFTVVSPVEAGQRGGHVTVDPGEALRVHDELLARGYAVDYRPGSGIRIGPHFFSTEDECHAVLAEMATIRDGH